MSLAGFGPDHSRTGATVMVTPDRQKAREYALLTLEAAARVKCAGCSVCDHALIVINETGGFPE